MGSQLLTLRQVRHAFRLIGEIRELGNDPQVWRRHMLQRLVALVGARLGTSAELAMPIVAGQGPPARSGLVAIGFADRGQEREWRSYSTRNDLTCNPLSPAVARINHRSFTCARQQLVDDHLWYRSEWINQSLRQLRLDDCLMSHQVLPRLRCIHSIWLHRDWGDRLFTQADVRLLHLFHAELARLWRQSPRMAIRGLAPNPPQILPPRLRQTLEALLDGKSEKQVAIKLGLSRHTVHKYVIMLHQRLGVCSNGELLALFLDSPFRPHPRLALQWPNLGLRSNDESSANDQ